MSAPPSARLSTFELAYLLSGRTDDAASTARGLLGIPEEKDAVAAEAAGYSSLLLRGLLTEQQETILPKSWVGMVGHTVGTGSHWIALTTEDETESGFQLMVSGATTCLVITPESANVFGFVGLTETEPLATIAGKVVQSYADGREEANVLVRSVRPIEGSIRSIFLKRSKESGWELGIDPVFPDDDAWPAPDIVLSSGSRDEALAAVADLLEARGALAPEK